MLQGSLSPALDILSSVSYYLFIYFHSRQHSQDCHQLVLPFCLPPTTKCLAYDLKCATSFRCSPTSTEKFFRSAARVLVDSRIFPEISEILATSFLTDSRRTSLSWSLSNRSRRLSTLPLRTSSSVKVSILRARLSKLQVVLDRHLLQGAEGLPLAVWTTIVHHRGRHPRLLGRVRLGG